MAVRGAGSPVLGVVAGVRLVVRDDVVPRSLEVLVDAFIEAVARGLAHIALFERVDEGARGALDEEEGGRLERLDEALCESDGEAIAIPVLRDASDPHLEMARGRRIVQHAEARSQ